MIQIDDKILSLDIFEQHFCCDLPKCLGICCVHGQSGAPLDNEEIAILEEVLDKVKPYMKPEGIKAIEKQGVAVIDSDKELVTPLIEGRECAFCIVENGINWCAIEKAWFEKKIDYRKPISCHLYPIRVKKYSTFTGLNYDKWDVCEPARKLGVEKGLPVFEFLKEPLIRAFGNNFYEQIEEAAKLLNNSKSIVNPKKSKG